MHNDIVDNMDSSKVTALTLLDLSAAFDTTGHLILLQLLHRHFGISGTALRWFKSYFSDCHKALTHLAHYLVHNTFHSSLALFCLTYIIRLSAKSLLHIISVITCMLMTDMFTYHFHNQIHKNLFRL